jgi:hypothetical protein
VPAQIQEIGPLLSLLCHCKSGYKVTTTQPAPQNSHALLYRVIIFLIIVDVHVWKKLCAKLLSTIDCIHIHHGIHSDATDASSSVGHWILIDNIEHVGDNVLYLFAGGPSWQSMVQ